MKATLIACVLAASLLSVSAKAQSSEDDAGDTSEIDKADRGPLRDRIAPVSSHQFLKKGRFEISPSATASVRDAFFTKYIFGGTLTYHATETFAFGLRAGYSIPTVAPTAEQCTLGGGCHPFTFPAIDGRAPGQILLIGGLDAQWAPIYGKLSLLSERFLHFDLYGVAGASVVEYGGPRPDPTSPTPRLWTVGGNVGAGTRVFINRFMTVRIELRDLIYVETVNALASSISTSNSTTANSLRNQLLFELGLSFFFPTSFGEL